MFPNRNYHQGYFGFAQDGPTQEWKNLHVFNPQRVNASKKGKGKKKSNDIPSLRSHRLGNGGNCKKVHNDPELFLSDYGGITVITGKNGEGQMV